MAEERNISEKLKEYLVKKLNECENKIIKLKRKRKVVKILYYSSITLSISLAGIMTTLSTLTALPILVIPVLSTSMGILTGLSAKFNFQNKKVEINNLIARLNKIQTKLDYVVSCNGDITRNEYQEILREFNF